MIGSSSFVGRQRIPASLNLIVITRAIFACFTQTV